MPASNHKTDRPGLWRALCGFDTLGTLLLLGSISSLLLAFSNHTAFLYPWSDPRVWALLVAFGVLLCLFVGYEGRYAKNPIVPLSLFKGQTLPCIFLSNFTLSVAAQTFVRSLLLLASSFCPAKTNWVCVLFLAVSHVSLIIHTPSSLWFAC